MSEAPCYIVVNADRLYYRRSGRSGVARWVQFPKDATKFVNVETATLTAETFSTASNRCQVLSGKPQQRELQL
jgi:hypothetical protein